MKKWIVVSVILLVPSLARAQQHLLYGNGSQSVPAGVTGRYQIVSSKTIPIPSGYKVHLLHCDFEMGANDASGQLTLWNAGINVGTFPETPETIFFNVQLPVTLPHAFPPLAVNSLYSFCPEVWTFEMDSAHAKSVNVAGYVVVQNNDSKKAHAINADFEISYEMLPD
jgi:hypothetical protein